MHRSCGRCWIVEFTYRDGEQRRVEPYVIWRDENDAWQLGGWSLGYSKSNSNPPWRCYNLSAIQGDVTVTDTSFTGNRPDYNATSDRYANACRKV